MLIEWASNGLSSKNQIFKKQFKYESSVYKHFLDVVQFEASFDIDEYFRKAVSGEIQSFDANVLQQNGQPIDTMITLLPTNIGNREIYVLLSNTKELCPEKEQYIPPDILKKEEQLNILYDNPDIGIWSANIQENQVTCTSKGIENITGYRRQCFRGAQEWTSIIYHEDLNVFYINQQKLQSGQAVQQHYRIKHRSGKLKWIQDYAIPTIDQHGKICRIDGILSDITEQKKLEDQLNFLANYDDLTKLPNRKKFHEDLEHLVRTASKENDKFAVIKFDIDNFKYINDTLGFDIGDELLKQYPNRIKKHLSPLDIVARRTGDGFAILINKIPSIKALIEQVNKIIECLKTPFFIKEYKLYVTASFGISTFPENGFTSLELLRNARLALSIAEKEGRDTYHLLSPCSSDKSYKMYSIGRDLKKALEENEMTLYYQPRICSKTNKIIGAEALIRWKHPDWGIISPNEFLPLAEENGLISEIDYWVFKTVCQQIKDWKASGFNVVPISINISGVQLIKPNLIQRIEEMLHDTKVSPDEIELEITEHILLSDSEMVKRSLTQLKDLGITLALDDFGTGYSSLSYLSKYSFDIIKIDRAFINNMHNSKRELHIIKSIIYMIRGLDLKVVAEGVETMDQLRTLQKEQCHEIQGYLFSKPIPKNEFEILLQNPILKPKIASK